MVALNLFAGEQQAGLCRKIGRRERVSEAKRQVHLSGADCFAQGLLGDVRLTGLALSQRRQQLGRARMIAADGRGTGLDVSARRIV
jgi:hypothetical protein